MSITREFRRFANRRKPGKQRTKCKRCGAKMVKKPNYGIVCPECGWEEVKRE